MTQEFILAICLFQTVYLPLNLLALWGRIQERKKVERALIHIFKAQTQQAQFRRRI